MKFAVEILAFDNSDYILACISNCAPFVDEIIVAYSEQPFTYTADARNKYRNSFDVARLADSPFYHKIKVIHGVWDYEEEMRTTCLDYARENGFDYLFVQDPDEFYFADDYRNMLRHIQAHPEFDFYFVDWINFWKTKEYVLVNDDGTTACPSPTVCVNLNRNVRFTSRRTVDSSNGSKMPVTMYHLAYVRTDEEMLRKISTWSHSTELNPFFYNYKWKKWNLDSRYLHPSNGLSWPRAQEFSNSLPEEIDQIRMPAHGQYRKNHIETFLESLIDCFLLTRQCCRKCRNLIKKACIKK